MSGNKTIAKLERELQVTNIELTKALGEQLKWTSKKPVDCGWYWYQATENTIPYVVHVILDNELLVFCYELWDLPCRLADFGGQWSDTKIQPPSR